MQNKIIMHMIPQQVKVRKCEVDTEKLKVKLKYYKNKSGYSNKKIAEILE